MDTLTELNSRFGSGRLLFEAGPAGLIRASLSTNISEAELYLHGAHVTRFRKRDSPPVLFLSDKSCYAQRKAIRGGIPVVFPWFGAHPSDPTKPAHGFARIMTWSVVEAETSADRVQMTLRLAANDDTRELWPHEFVASLAVTLDDRLTVALEVANISSESFEFEEALHSYISVGDVRRALVHGLEETAYIDKKDMKRKLHGPSPIVIEQETDRVFLNTAATCTISDPDLQRSVVIDKSGSSSTIIWNPHSEKAKAMSDLGDDDWQQMICVETGNVADNLIHLNGGERWLISATIDSRPMGR